MSKSCPHCGHRSGGSIGHVAISCSACKTEACDMCLTLISDEYLCNECMGQELLYLRDEVKQLRAKYLRDAPHLEGCDRDHPELAPDCPVCAEITRATLTKDGGSDD